jgi:hypothetical protein
MKNRRWRDLSLRGRIVLILCLGLSLAFAATAEVDLARRPAARVRGPKRLWASAIAGNWLLGPSAYFAVGRKRG